MTAVRMTAISYDNLVAYATGGLNLEEEGEVERYFSDHPEEAGPVRDSLDALTALILSEEPAELPADAEAHLLASIRVEQNSRLGKAKT